MELYNLKFQNFERHEIFLQIRTKNTLKKGHTFYFKLDIFMIYSFRAV